MKVIWKFKLDVSRGDRVCASMPKGALILSAGIQDGIFVVWALVDPDAPRVNRIFSVHGTGHSIPAEVEWSAFINTIFMESFVFHVFYMGEQV